MQQAATGEGAHTRYSEVVARMGEPSRPRVTSAGQTLERLRAGGSRRKCALILAGAAGKGPFAAGALSVVTKHLTELDIVCVVGTSAGALNAAVFAAGLRADRAYDAANLLEMLWKDKATLFHILTQKSRQKILHDALEEFRTSPEAHPVTLRIAMTSLNGDVEIVGNRRHYTTYESIATFHGVDFETERGIDAIARHAIASAAIPFVFAPVRADGTSYVDGGVVDNAPIGWALRQDPEIEHLLVVTSDPRLSRPPRWVGRFPFSPLIDVIVRERLTRDLAEAYSFNEELKTLRALGVDMKRVRRDLHWRDLDIVEIRPPEATPGDFFSGFLSKGQRSRNWSAGRDAAARALEDARSQPTKPAIPSAPTLNRRAAAAQSQHLRKSSELLLIAPIRRGLVPVAGLTTTYPGRLKQLLSVLFLLRQTGVERFAGTANLVGPLETIDSLHFVQWAILDEGPRLLLSATFDGPWESYIRDIVDRAGPFLDSIFCHCEEYSDGPHRNSTNNGYENFAAWVRKHQVATSFYYSAAPDMTAGDTRWLRKLADLRATTRCPDFEAAATQLATSPPAGGPVPPMTFIQALGAFFFLSASFTPQEVVFLARAAIGQLDLLDRSPATPSGLSGTTLDAWNWYKDTLVGLRKRPPHRLPEVLDAPNTVQGNILTAYRDRTHGRLVLLQFTSPAHAADFVSTFRPTTHDRQDPLTRNIALTFPGLQRLGLNSAVLADFPEEFREGMELRAPMLGDVGINHPYSWERPVAYPNDPRAPRVDLSTIDAVVVYQSTSSEASQLDPLVNRLTQQPGVRVLSVQNLKRSPPEGGFTPEPFGFADGISQPIPRIEGFPGPDRDRVALGELLLGYENEAGENPHYSNRALLQNGSFLAMRKFEQRVQEFQDFVQDNAGLVGGLAPGGRSNSEVLQGKIMGRYPDGTPLAADWRKRVGNGDLNDFDYTDARGTGKDKGQGCPLAAHVRRANPRLKDTTPRILRRGFAYHDSDDDRGLVFMAYCASLGSQYEVVQKWVNGGNSTGTYGGQVDPTLAVKGIADATYSFLLGGRVVSVPMPDKPLARVMWGLYLFAPSTTGLDEIARLAREAAKAATSPGRCPFGHAAPAVANAAIADGEKILDGLDALDAKTALDRWRALLESDDPAPAAEGRDVNAALRARRGFQPTAYGVLVSRIEDNLAVLANRTDYSVCEYGKRMRDSFGLLYLGQDSEDGHDEAALVPNDVISAITREAAYMAALEAGLAVFAGARPTAPKVPGSERVLVDLQQWADMVLCQLVEAWFGFPDESIMRKGGAALASRDLPCCPDDFRMISGYIFGPQPTNELSAFAQRRGRLVAKAASAFTQARSKAVCKDSQVLIDRLLLERYMGGDEDAIARAWLGAVNGFTVPTGENFTLIMYSWLQSRVFWRLQQEYRAVPTGSLDFLRGGPPPGFLFRETLRTMQESPVPFLLHRRVREAHDVSPGVRATPATPVVINLTSAAAEALDDGSLDPAVLFGGAYKSNKGPRDPVHACPGQEMAWGVMMGLAAAVFEQKNVMSEGLLAVSVD